MPVRPRGAAASLTTDRRARLTPLRGSHTRSPICGLRSDQDIDPFSDIGGGGSVSPLGFLPHFLPDISEDDFRQALREFAARERRFGGRPAMTGGGSRGN